MSLAIGGAGNHSGWNQMRWRKRSQVVRDFVGQDEGHRVILNAMGSHWTVQERNGHALISIFVKNKNFT